MSIKLVIFDFDGVIVDSYGVCKKVTEHFLPDISDEDYKELFTGNIYDQIEKSEKHNSAAGNVNNSIYFDLYEPLILQLKPRDGFIEIIDGIFNRGIKIAFVSSSFNKPLTNFLKKYNLLKYSNDILGGDIERSKVKKFLSLLKKYKLNTQEVLFITDTLGDLREAKKADIPSIGVTFGFHDRSFLEQESTVDIVDRVEALKHSIEKIVSKNS